MSENVVTSSNSAPKKVAPKNKVEPRPRKELNERDKPIAVAPEGFKFVYFESGSAYVTTDGFRFSRDKRINLVSDQEAEHLLSFPNFRLPSQLELEDHSKEI